MKNIMQILSVLICFHLALSFQTAHGRDEKGSDQSDVSIDSLNTDKMIAYSVYDHVENRLYSTISPTILSQFNSQRLQYEKACSQLTAELKMQGNPPLNIRGMVKKGDFENSIDVAGLVGTSKMYMGKVFSKSGAETLNPRATYMTIWLNLEPALGAKPTVVSAADIIKAVRASIPDRKTEFPKPIEVNPPVGIIQMLKNFFSSDLSKSASRSESLGSNDLPLESDGVGSKLPTSFSTSFTVQPTEAGQPI